MYNDRRYSLARYSVNRETRTVEIAEHFSEAMGAVAGAAVPVDLRGRFAETLLGSARGTVSLVSALSAGSSLEAAVRMSANVLAGAAFGETLSASVYGQKDLPAVLGSGEELKARVWGGKDMPASLELAERLNQRISGSKNIIAVLSVFEVLTSLLEATSHITERAVFQLTIPPGGELRIDSDLFTVLLDGENALHTQSGDWVNLSRELWKLTVESASGGGLEGQLIYTERYL